MHLAMLSDKNEGHVEKQTLQNLANVDKKLLLENVKKSENVKKL